MSPIQFAVSLVIVLAVAAIVVVAAKAFGVPIPDWAVRVFWIMVIAVVAIMAIRFLGAI